jgi:anti-sigma regulatory factor (Ser/Thr protein kinase)
MDGSGEGLGERSGERVARLAGGRDQVARARRLVSAALGRDHPLHDDCVLLTSELATNAVVHSRSGEGGTFTVIVSCREGRVRIRVQDDGSAEPPCARRATVDGAGGRGLPLLDALSDRWGVVREAGRNEVWFELAQKPQRAQKASRSARIRASHAPSWSPSPAW